MTQIIGRTGFVQDRWARTELSRFEQGYFVGCAVELPVDTLVQSLGPLINRAELIVIPFAASSDGRGFSLAASLRMLGYSGHLRARGHILVDQFRAALRCGFTDIEITDDQAARNPEDQWKAVTFTDAYQSRLFAA